MTHSSPVGYASDVLDQFESALKLIEKMFKENDYGKKAKKSLKKDKKRFEKAKTLMLKVLQNEN